MAPTRDRKTKNLRVVDALLKAAAKSGELDQESSEDARKLVKRLERALAVADRDEIGKAVNSLARLLLKTKRG